MMPRSLSRPLLALPLLALFALLAATGCSLNPDERQAYQEALARWEDQRLAPQDSLVAALRHSDAHVRLAAARGAGLIGRSDVLAELLKLLDDPSSTVARQAAFSLGLLGDLGAEEDLENTALRSADPGLRVAALQGARGQLPGNGGALMQAALKADETEAAAAWDGLRNVAAQADSAQLDATLRAGLQTQRNEVLWRVLRCAERTPWDSLTPEVAAHVRSRHPQVRVHAYRALARLNNAPGPGSPGCRCPGPGLLPQPASYPGGNRLPARPGRPGPPMNWPSRRRMPAPTGTS
jgi:hypothetical protein